MEQRSMSTPKSCEVHSACNFFGLKEPADLPPHVLHLDVVVINPVGRAIHRDANLGDIRVDVLF